MRTLGLLVCLVLLGLGTLLLVLVGLLSLGLNWQDFLIYLAVALVVYGIVWLVGRSLNGRFDRSVRRFLDGETDDLTYDKGSLRTFGLLLVVLLPFLVYLLLFALYSAITFAWYGMLLILESPRIPIVVPFAFIVVVIGTALGILSGFKNLVRPPRRVPFGVSVKPEEHRKLWAVSRELAESLRARPVDDIVVTPGPGIGVYLGGSVLGGIFGRGRRTLEIGIPSLHDLSVGEFSSILAHEYGHFSHRDTQWGSFTYSMGIALVSALRATPGPHSGKGNALFRLILAANPAYWIFRVFISLFGRVTNGFSRVREVMADLLAIRRFGGTLFADALSRVVLNDKVFSDAFQSKLIPEAVQEGRTVDSLDRSMRLAYEDAGDAAIGALRTQLLAESPSAGDYDSHPATAVRLDYARRLSGPVHDDRTPVSDLFDDWDALNVQVAGLFNQRLLAYAQAIRAQTGQSGTPAASSG